jgi:hypothetical protein
MTLQEQKRYAANFMKRRTSRIVSHQNGLDDVMKIMQFGQPQPSYNSDSQEEANASTDGAPVDTRKIDVIGDPAWDGSVPADGSNDDSEITGALAVIQKRIDALGNADLLNIWASTSDALKKTVSGDSVRKAVPNPEGVTRAPLHVEDNTAASWPGSQGYIPASELSNAKAVHAMEAEAKQLTKITARICEVTAL